MASSAGSLCAADESFAFSAPAQQSCCSAYHMPHREGKADGARIKTAFDLSRILRRVRRAVEGIRELKSGAALDTALKILGISFAREIAILKDQREPSPGGAGVKMNRHENAVGKNRLC
jgi:hypothetical protein